MDHKELIGKLVISSNFGVGSVVSLESMSGRDFLVIESQGNVKNFVPASDTDSYRLLASKDELNDIISMIKNNRFESHNYDSKKDRIEHFKKTSKIQDMDMMANLLLELLNLDDRSSAEDLIMNKFIDSFALEHSIVFHEKEENSKELILDALNLNAS